MLPEITLEDIALALDATAAKTLSEANFREPPIDAVQLAQRLGLTIAWDDRQQGRARLVNLSPPDRSGSLSILLKRDPRVERVHWAVAHEIGESLAQRVFAALGVDAAVAPQQAREMVANGIASRLLLPAESFVNDAPDCDWDLMRLKKIYATASHELIARRMLDFPLPVIISVYDHNQLVWRKSNARFRLPPPSAREISCRRQTHKLGMATDDDGPPRLRAWPIHEHLWKREIVRIEMNENEFVDD